MALPAGEVRKAQALLQKALKDEQERVEKLQQFLDENEELMQLVAELPEKTCHKVMVPFGKAAFFEGQLIHANELVVLLGDGYYAERSAHQTVELLDRRKDLLTSNLAKAKTHMEDTEARVSFAQSTADESEAGVVDIREDYVEPAAGPTEQAGTTGITAPSKEVQPKARLPPKSPHKPRTAKLEQPALSKEQQGGDAKPGKAGTGSNDDDDAALFARMQELEEAERKALRKSAEDEEPEGDRVLTKQRPRLQPTAERPYEAASEPDEDEGQYAVEDLEDFREWSSAEEEEEEEEDEPLDLRSAAEELRRKGAGTLGEVSGGLSVSVEEAGEESQPEMRSPGDLLAYEWWKRQRYKEESNAEDSNPQPPELEVQAEPRARRKSVRFAEELETGPATSKDTSAQVSQPREAMQETSDEKEKEDALRKAFSGTVQEHATSSEAVSLPQAAPEEAPRKPSRFKERMRGTR